jgi:membrane protein implicated in regulation of membrane protease activity
MIQDLWDFVKAVWTHGAPLLVSGVIAVVIAFLDHLPGNFKWVFWLLSGLSLFIAVFRTWRDERHKRETEIAELNQKMAVVNRSMGN